MLKSMNDKANAMLRERERIINMIEMLEESYRGNGELERAAACKGIVDHLRWAQ
jgi:hypothetical protein